jgi:hypothetical protein
LENNIPFGESFGTINDRNEAIEGSHRIYYKLLKCSPEKNEVPFEVLSWTCFDEKDTQDAGKLKAVRRLFRPDAHGNISLLAFVQSCDTIYKRFCYFNASVMNASAIDDQLERIINGFFGLVLGMLLLFIMKINPWPLLLSMTSLLVSVSFALGPSVSKYVEVSPTFSSPLGVIMVAYCGVSHVWSPL